MLFSDYIIKAEELVIEQADNGLYYLEPMWRSILYDNQMDISAISDSVTDWGGVFDILRLEVEKRNTINSKKQEVIQWLYNLIYSQIEPVMLDQETELMKNVLEYMKTKNESQP